MTTEPNKAEERLISKIQQTLQMSQQQDNRDGGYYFPNDSLPRFQQLASQTAKLIEKQGISGTFNNLVKAARNIQGLGETGFRNANAIAFAFKKHIDIPGAGTNPFSGIDLS